MVTNKQVSNKRRRRCGPRLTIRSSSISLQVHLGHLAILNFKSEALAASAAKNGGGAVKAHIESLGEDGGRVGNPSNLHFPR